MTNYSKFDLLLIGIKVELVDELHFICFIPIGKKKRRSCKTSLIFKASEMKPELIQSITHSINIGKIDKFVNN